MKIVVFGGTSAIAVETIKQFNKNETEVLLIDINQDRLNSVKNDIIVVSGIDSQIIEWNLSEIELQPELLNTILSKFGDFDIAYIAYGTLLNQETIRHNVQAIKTQLTINFLSIVTLSSVISEYFEKRNKGLLAVISSVAGDRGRQSNFIYGSAKGGLSLFLQGLRNRLNGTNITILTIKPGMVDTPMTSGMQKGILFSSAENVGKLIYKAIIDRKENVYVPGFWKIIMLVIQHIPESIFKKLKL